MSNDLHVPVLLDETVEFLKPKKGDRYLDLTAGYGGHAVEVIKLIGDESLATLVDRDAFAVAKLKERFPRARVLHMDFAGAVELLSSEGAEFDMILADLGVSSVQFDQAERGFSFRTEAKLDMRMDERQELDAWQVVNRYGEKKLQKILEEYGEEPKAKQIAEVLAKKKPMDTTKDLERAVKLVYGSTVTKKNPAARTFQAIRIEVNDELGQLRRALSSCLEIMAGGARFAVITFHGLEDGVVKEFFKLNSGGYDGVLKDLKVLKSSDTIDLVRNRRSRSAILRSCIYENKNNTN